MKRTTIFDTEEFTLLDPSVVSDHQSPEPVMRTVVREAGLEPASLSAGIFKTPLYTVPALARRR
jgi:hypothetical protein